MINVSAIHQHAAQFQSRGQANLDQMRGRRKGKHKDAVEKEQEKTTTAKKKRPETEFSTDWRTDPRYNPNNIPAGNLSHPDPVNANRMRAFNDAAQRLAAHADHRVDEIRNAQTQQRPTVDRRARMDAALRNQD